MLDGLHKGAGCSLQAHSPERAGAEEVYQLRQKRENIRLRLEVGKLADELEQLRKKAQGEDKGKSSDESA